ncbi:MAG: alpha/beta fold hydrolase [Candidatus Latescibacterota bacterium]|nr:alpha/beta fold hydrolase [Candidatus Latescibacterota bacterium]
MTVDIADDTARPVEALPVVEDSVAVGEENGQEIRMAYRAVGPKHARTKLLLLHGLFDHKGTWRNLMSRLASPDCQLIAVDLVGHGYSNKPQLAATPRRERYSLDMQTRYLREFVRRLDLDDVVLGGSSLGGGLALRMVCSPWPQAPRVRGLILAAAAGYQQNMPGYIGLLQGWPGALIASSWGARLAHVTGLTSLVTRITLRHAFYDPAAIRADAIAEAVAIQALERTLYAYRYAARNLIPTDIEHFPESYSQISCPTLVLWGQQDRVVPPLYALRFEADIPEAELKVYESCGHAVHIERVGEVAADIQRWLDERVFPSS